MKRIADWNRKSDCAVLVRLFDHITSLNLAAAGNCARFRRTVSLAKSPKAEGCAPGI
jgi:hypothetical protein